MIEINKIYHDDCLNILKQLEDKSVDLLLTDPPYGGGGKDNIFQGKNQSRFAEGGWCKKYKNGNSEESILKKKDGVRIDGNFDKYCTGGGAVIKASRTGGTWSKKYQSNLQVHRSSKPGGAHKNYSQGSNIVNWDYAPTEEYFAEMFRVSKNQIIWGGNYFSLPPTRCFLIWDKLTISEKFSMAMCEYAWTSFNSNAKRIELAPQDATRFHPTQKPLQLFKWCLNLFSKENDLILDCYSGSGTTAIAASELKRNFICVEKDEYYYNESVKRLEKYNKQLKLF